MQAQQLDPSQAVAFILAGSAIFTMVSKRTGERYTYKVTVNDRRPGEWFVKLLTGPSNTSDYTYLGMIKGNKLIRTKSSRIGEDALPFAVLAWYFAMIRSGQVPQSVEIWHEGRCGRCGLPLTVPASIALGIGPECAKKMAA